MKRWFILSLVVLAVPALGCNDDNRIPNWQTASCAACHSNPPYSPRNSFGNDYRSMGHTWSPSLAALDSDGDGWTNGEELQDPDGDWSLGEPAPGDSALVTNPGSSSSHPEGTATPTEVPIPTETPEPTTEPTATPTDPGEPTPTPTDPGEPTATPTPPADLTLDVFTSQETYRFGDSFSAGLSYDNGSAPLTVRQYVVLEFAGSYYFYPAWTQAAAATEREIPSGLTEETFLEFTWPEVDGAADGLHFWFAAVDPGSGELVGNYDMIEWGFE